MSEMHVIYIALIGFGVWMLMLSRRVNHVEKMMIGLQAAIPHLPSKDDVHRLERSVDALRIEMAAAREADAALRSQINTLLRTRT